MTYHGSEGCQGTQGAPAAAGGAKQLPPGGQSYFLSNGWSKSIVPENKVAINFDFRSGAKKSGHLDYPFKSYGPKFVSMHETCGEVGVKKKSHGYNFQFQASI